jgi:hypothetical protein
LERYDVTAPITFVLAGLLLTHRPLAVLGIAPSRELIKELAEFTLALVLFSDASRVGLHELRVNAGIRWPPGTHNTSPVSQAQRAGAEIPGIRERRLIRRLPPARAMRGVA